LLIVYKKYNIMVFLYSIFHPVTRCLCKTYGKMEVFGLENFPEKGGVVLASNHVSYLDPIVLGSAAPRQLYFLARDTLFRKPFARLLLPSFNAIPMHRDAGDLTALRKAIKLLKDGHVVSIFPEGTRSRNGKLQKGKAGVALLAVKSLSKIVPARIEGTDRCLPRGSKFIKPGKLTVRFGKPIDCSIYSEEKSKDLYFEISERVIEDIRRLGSD